jgi:hypothetical protein
MFSGPNIKFLGILIDNSLSKKSNIELLTSKLSAACAVRMGKPFMSQDICGYIFCICSTEFDL